MTEKTETIEKFLAIIDALDTPTNEDLDVQHSSDSGIVEKIKQLKHYVGKHKFSEHGSAVYELTGLIGIWESAKFDSSPKRSVNTIQLEKLHKTAIDLESLVSQIDIRRKRLLEYRSAPRKEKLDLDLLAIQLSQLSHSTETMLHSIEHKPPMRTRKRQATDYIVSHLYSIFSKYTGNTGKYSRDPYSEDPETQYSGAFFFALKDFYKILGIGKGDSGIADDIDRLTSSPIELTDKKNFLGLSLK